MPSCPSCGAEKSPSAVNAPCARCGAVTASPSGSGSLPDLELNVPKRPAPRAVKAVRPADVGEMKIELAVEPSALVAEAGGMAPAPATTIEARPVGPKAAPTALVQRVERASAAIAPDVGDVAFDAKLLADYGELPRHWLLSPLYAWRVLRRQRELKKVLVGRRDETTRAQHEVEDALVAFAERARPTAEHHNEYAVTLEELRGAEDVLRSRDRVLASEQDAQTARLASVDGRLAKLEADVAHAQAQEHTIAAELVSAQAALARGDAKLKRAESELRAAVQRESDEAHP